MSGSSVISYDSFFAFALLLLYVIGGGFMESRKFPVGHETGIALIFGLMISALIHFTSNDHGSSWEIAFDPEVLFYVCLPPIIFASGFNMRRRRFFDNIGYILLFGVFGTITTFIVFTYLTYGFVKTGEFKMYYSKNNT
jgi:NhaP-type Na+/H+ or K+/H+ antiporter